MLVLVFVFGISSENATEFAMVDDDDFGFASSFFFSLFPPSIDFCRCYLLYINKKLCTYSSLFSNLPFLPLKLQKVMALLINLTLYLVLSITKVRKRERRKKEGG